MKCTMKFELNRQDIITLLREYHNLDNSTEIDFDFVDVPPEPPVQEPTQWYPDNSGKWIMFDPDSPVKHSPDTIVEWVTHDEFAAKHYLGCTKSTWDELDTEFVKMYKVVGWLE